MDFHPPLVTFITLPTIPTKFTTNAVVVATEANSSQPILTRAPPHFHPTAFLSRQAELNIECNHLATAALQIARPSPLVTFLPAGKVAVTIEGQSINRKLRGAIRTLIGRRLQLSSFNRRYGWSASQFDQID
jgi:hypothetical protein